MSSAQSARKSRIPIVLGAAHFGTEKNENIHVSSVEEAREQAQVLLKHGHNQLDTSNGYGNGTSEVLLGKLGLKDVVIDTKLWPTVSPFTPEGLREGVKLAAEKLHPYKIGVLYLHAPDRTIPSDVTHRELDALHKQGLFQEFGLSNFNSWEVVEFAVQAKHHGWIAPTVYQGAYNVIYRAIEPELLPALRKYNIRFYAYSPLAAGFLTNSYLEGGAKEGNKLHDSWPWNDLFRRRYGHSIPFLEHLLPVAVKYNLKLNEIAFRWLQHHSQLEATDGLVIGARNIEQLENTLALNELGPLPDEVLKAIEEGYAKISPKADHYAF